VNELGSAAGKNPKFLCGSDWPVAGEVAREWLRDIVPGRIAHPGHRFIVEFDGEGLAGLRGVQIHFVSHGCILAE
jgi:hypothetical protein